jgi:TolB-like protein/Tfp pilus assembly protein PilF
MADVFISYAREDAAGALRVARALQAAGFDVWWDADLPAHRAYSEVIERNLEAAKAVVALWSNAAAKSQWVRAEADFARNADKLVQASFDGALPPMPFNQIQCADLKGWRGGPSHSGWAKLKGSVEALVSGKDAPQALLAPAGVWERLQPYRWWMAAALLMVAMAAAFLLALGRPTEERKPVVAVLPFKSLDARDASLVAGMWEDTRQAIGRNPQLVVLGPHTTEQLAQRGEGAAKGAADYLVQASVRTAGDRIRVSTDLVRTEDGAQLWSQGFDRKLDDIFALQSQIASEIEGRIRGRLARGGGVKPEHIATSGNVYALYSDARAKIRKRDFTAYPAARDQLEQVVKMDPNFAPAWATLSVVEMMLPPSVARFNINERAGQYAQKAVELAPNLAAGHAALALALNFEGPVARAEIERAVRLDPNDHEALLWLGNVEGREGRKKAALAAYSRAAEIEPLFWPAVLNKLDILQDLRDEAGIRELIERERRLGAQHLVAAMQIELAREKGDLAEAANVGLEYWKAGSQDGRPVIAMTLWSLLLQLGFDDKAWKISPAPPFAPHLFKNDPKGLEMVESMNIAPRQFFSMVLLPQNASRVYVVTGRSQKLADMYLSLRLPPEQFMKLAGGGYPSLYSATMVAVALRQTGHSSEAARLLGTAESAGVQQLKDGQAESQALLARIYAVQGRKEDALSLLATAVNRNWLPAPPLMLTDITLDPAFAGLKGDPRFERLRQHILGTIKRERAQVRISDLN